MDEIIYKAREKANECFGNFCELIGLDSKLFEHIYNIPMKEGKSDGLAEYRPNEKIIIVDKDYVKDTIAHYDNEEHVILDIAYSFIHEMIHANRTIMIENGLNSFNVKKADDELLLYGQKKRGYDVDLYISLLEEVINRPYIENLKKYIPIKVKVNKDGSYFVIAFNIETKDFDLFDNQFFNTKRGNDTDKFRYELGKELEKHKPSEIIYSKTNNENDKFAVICDYFMPYNKSGKLVYGNGGESNMSKEDYFLTFDLNRDAVLDRLENSNGFEESITEALALIMILVRDEKSLNIDNIVTTILEKEKSPNIYLAAILIQRMGIDMIRWFMTSAYSEFYDDKFEKIFRDRYDDLLLDFNDLYEASIYGEEPYQFSIDDINKIFDDKIKKSR